MIKCLSHNQLKMIPKNVKNHSNCVSGIISTMACSSNILIHKTRAKFHRDEKHEARICSAPDVAPDGGDNVTMQQLMDTMCALQEAVATSRVEIAASHADNQELRKTNKEPNHCHRTLIHFYDKVPSS